MKTVDANKIMESEAHIFTTSEEDDALSLIDISLVVEKDSYEHFGDICRICLSRRNFDALMHICICSDALVHKECLEARLKSLCTDKCELCDYKYNLKWDTHYSIPKGMWLWIMFHVSRIQLLLMALLGAIVVSEAVIFFHFIIHSLQTTRESGVGESYEQNRTVTEYWQHIVSELYLPSWFLSLSILLCGRQLLLLVSLVADITTTFLRWYCSNATLTILLSSPDGLAAYRSSQHLRM